jgi:hypothetical protein
MDNTLVYETGDCGSIPYVGAKIEYRVSSVVEQRLDKALVASSNLASGTKKQLTTTVKGCIITFLTQRGNDMKRSGKR